MGRLLTPVTAFSSFIFLAPVLTPQHIMNDANFELSHVDLNFFLAPLHIVEGPNVNEPWITNNSYWFHITLHKESPTLGLLQIWFS